MDLLSGQPDVWSGLNAPPVARCFMTRSVKAGGSIPRSARLNAPFGARCFMTSWNRCWEPMNQWSLNAPFGARCFMTKDATGMGWPKTDLMS